MPGRNIKIVVILFVLSTPVGIKKWREVMEGEGRGKDVRKMRDTRDRTGLDLY